MTIAADKTAQDGDAIEPTVPSVNPQAEPTTIGTATAYKLVKVRKADGSVVTVKRPVKHEEPVVDSGSALDAGPQGSPESKPFKIVTVRKADGSLVKVKRPVPLGESSGGPSTAEAPGEASLAPENSTNKNQASQNELDDQMANRRARKMHRFKSSLTRGLATVIASAIPSIDIADGFHDGDEILSDGELSGSADDDDLETGTGDEEDHAELQDGYNNEKRIGEDGPESDYLSKAGMCLCPVSLLVTLF